MATAKRLYLYIVSAVGLGLIVFAGSTMLRLLLDRAGVHAVNPNLFYGFEAHPVREALAGALGMMVVGLPLWLIHWGLIERAVRGQGPEAEAERQSLIRSLFFGLVLATLLVTAASAAVDALREGLARPLGATDPWAYVDIAGSAGTAIIFGAAWCYYAAIRARDLRRGPAISGPAAWMSRLYLYGAALAGIGAALAATSTVITTLVDAISGSAGPGSYSAGFDNGGFGPTPLVMPTAAWWVRPVVAGGMTLLIWGWVWCGHLLYASRLRARRDAQGEAEGRSQVRLAYFVAVVAAAVAVVAGAFATGLGALVGAAVGAEEIPGTTAAPIWHDVIGPPAAAAFVLVAWWAHRRYGIGDQARNSGASALRAIRPMDYLTALIGIAFLTYGLAALLGLLIERITGAPSLGYGQFGFGSWRHQAGMAIGDAVVGVPLLLWPWLAARRRLATDRASEVRSASRRSYLFLVTGLAVINGGWALAVIASQAARVAVGLDSSGLGSSVSFPLAVAVVAGAVVAVAGPILNRDMKLRAGTSEAAGPVAEATVGGPGPVIESGPAGPSPRGVEIVIGAPGYGDMEPLRAWLAASLPPVYTITVRPADEVLPGPAPETGA